MRGGRRRRMVGGVPQKDPRQGQSYSMASSRSGGGAAGVLRRALVALCAASIMGGDRAAAAVQCVGAPCVLGEYSGVSRARNDTLLSAVGCEQEFHVSFGTAFRDTANIEVSMCARSATGVCVNKLNSIVSIDQELVSALHPAPLARGPLAELPRVAFSRSIAARWRYRIAPAGASQSSWRTSPSKSSSVPISRSSSRPGCRRESRLPRTGPPPSHTDAPAQHTTATCTP